ncbi:MAG: hypothetical protein KF709_00845 [Gemmatimonadaceae bacterium]|nr:hypothetical protein [Gemmatimonadaceae bacterium]
MTSTAPQPEPTAAPLPAVSWQITGNHWFALPCIHPHDGAVHAVGLLHRGARSAVEFAGGEGFVDGQAPALAKPVIRVNGEVVELARAGIAWERALSWLPTFTSTVGELVVRGTIFAPFGQDADIAGAVYTLAFENRSKRPMEISVGLEGTLGHRQLRVRTPRAAEDAHRIREAGQGVVILDGVAVPGICALALAADGEASVQVAQGSAPTYAITRDISIPAGGRTDSAFYIAAGPERDGAVATVGVMRRRGWRSLLTVTRDSLRAVEQSTGLDSLDALINRNLLFAYFYGVGRALDDAHFYLVRSRAPWCAWGVTVRDWEALAWTVPAVQLADPPLARELILRACELHGYSPGRGVHYLDGTLFEPGFTLEGCASYAVATERYIRETGDDQIVEELILADTLYATSDELAARRDEQHPLFDSEVTLDGRPVAHPFPLHGNAVVAYALDALSRTLDEEAAREIQDHSAVRAALRRHFATGGESKSTLAAATDLSGHHDLADDSVGSALWLPMWEAIDRTDSLYRRTAKRITGREHLVVQVARLFGPDASEVLEWLRRAPLHDGFAAELVDEDGRARSHGGDAALSGLLAYTAWYTVHAFGIRP